MCFKRKFVGIVSLAVGIGMLLSIVMPWFNFFTAIIFISFGIWELLSVLP